VDELVNSSWLIPTGIPQAVLYARPLNVYVLPSEPHQHRSLVVETYHEIVPVAVVMTIPTVVEVKPGDVRMAVGVKEVEAQMAVGVKEGEAQMAAGEKDREAWMAEEEENNLVEQRVLSIPMEGQDQMVQDGKV